MSCNCRLVTARSVTLARASTRMRRLFRWLHLQGVLFAAIKHKCLPVSVRPATVCKHYKSRRSCASLWLWGVWGRHASSLGWAVSIWSDGIRAVKAVGWAEQNSNGRHGLCGNREYPTLTVWDYWNCTTLGCSWLLEGCRPMNTTLPDGTLFLFQCVTTVARDPCLASSDCVPGSGLISFRPQVGCRLLVIQLLWATSWVSEGSGVVCWKAGVVDVKMSKVLPVAFMIFLESQCYQHWECERTVYETTWCAIPWRWTCTVLMCVLKVLWENVHVPQFYFRTARPKRQAEKSKKKMREGQGRSFEKADGSQCISVISTFTVLFCDVNRIVCACGFRQLVESWGTKVQR